MAFNANFNNISVILWQAVLLVMETGVLGEKHRVFLLCLWIVFPWLSLSVFSYVYFFLSGKA
jgi:hypothetical protein